MFPRQAGRAALLSTQGFVISLPYCFLNTEVQGVLRSAMVQEFLLFISDIYAWRGHNMTVRDIFTVITVTAVIVTGVIIITVELTKVMLLFLFSVCHTKIMNL